MGNELSIDLRLALKKLREDIREANRMIKEGLNKAVNLGGNAIKGTKENGDEMDKLAIKTKRVNAALAEQLHAWKKLQNFRKPNVFIYGQTAMPRPNYSQYGPTLNPTQGPMGPGGGLATGSPYMGGTPPKLPTGPMLPAKVIPVVPPISTQDAASFWRRLLTGALATSRGSAWGGVVGTNQIFGAFGNTATGGRALGAMGLPGGAGGAALATGGAVVAILALVSAMKALQAVLRESIAAAERARMLYAKAITNGLGLQYNALRSNVASVLGVSEQDIYQFGDALSVLAPRLQAASKISSDAASVLAPLSYELRILKIDLLSLADSIGRDLAPILTLIIRGLDDLTKGFIAFYQTVLKPLASFIYYTANSKVGRAAIGAAIGPENTKELFMGLDALIRGMKDGSFNAHTPSSFMKQLPFSNFERMGLVASMASSPLVDYSRRTAIATEKIAAQMMGGVPRGIQPFGINPNVSNP